ncbi:hypothetical protein JOF56_007601 [Kibdelosporangium banguiense]|uniref:Nbr1 FW domain-containing protein n=1 Tax=Kibdelosporangium banguiense TaxID=1365924 RepID=A0ABS4TS25_9PSEU|nr:NBR1-Ig-like domain-containing protein [Kibdelosporangium banguiense]MBP2327216.1 hypothetical protein [Kibdelosporangium banguiense]
MSESTLHGDSREDQQHARRGRRHIVPDAASGPVARFACELLALKQSAGNPSYDQMRLELGAAASKSTLSAATRGRVLPSWAVTWEFVRSLAVTRLGHDVDVVRNEWQLRWETAKAGLASAVVEQPQDLTTSDKADSRRKRGLIAALATVGVMLAVVLLARVPQQSATAYPIPGDATSFGGDGLPGDETFPDGTSVHVGGTFTKIWRLKNIGTVPWHNRYLQISGGTTVLCESPDRIPVPDAAPGQMVEVSVPVTPKGTGVCEVVWKMVDAQGAFVFPDHRGVYYQVTVVP